MTKPKKLLGLLCVLVGLFSAGYCLYLVWDRNLPAKPISHISTVSGINYPLGVSIPSQHIVLPVKLANLQNGQWEDPKHSVAFWKDSPLPGDLGNSVFYGHNWPTIFGRLPKVKVGDSVQIAMSDGTTRDFKVSQTFTVTSDQTHIVAPTTDSRVTLYTCTGFLDYKRFVVVATRT